MYRMTTREFFGGLAKSLTLALALAIIHNAVVHAKRQKSNLVAEQQQKQNPFLKPSDQILHLKFEVYRAIALDIVARHSLRHKDCVVSKQLEAIANKNFNFGDIEDVAWSVGPYVIFNTRQPWTDRFAALVIIHESLHWEDANGKKVCKADKRNSISPCDLWGKQMNSSLDIQDALEAHLAPELKGLK